jgi:hypothetical protein
MMGDATLGERDFSGSACNAGRNNAGEESDSIGGWE